MKEKFNEVKEAPSAKFADSSLGKLSYRIEEKLKTFADRSVVMLEDQVKNCPIENGKWTGERGNSKWKPDRNYIPQKMNPEGKNWFFVSEIPPL
mgnify:CR=1 FL=1